MKLSGNQSRNFLSSLAKIGFPCSVLDLSELEFVTPVVCILAELATYLDIPVQHPYTPKLCHYLNYMSRSQKSSDRYISVFNLRRETEIPNLIRYFDHLFGDWLSQDSRYFVRYAFSELMDNVFHHAHSDSGLWIHAQKYPMYNAVEMALADLGIGISESIRNNPLYASYGATERFVLALNPGVTGKPDEHSGEGLSSVIEWVKHNPSAEGMVISLNSMWYKIENKSGFYHCEEIRWPGTFLWLNIPKEPIFSMEKIWEMLGLRPD